MRLLQQPKMSYYSVNLFLPVGFDWCMVLKKLFKKYKSSPNGPTDTVFRNSQSIQNSRLNDILWKQVRLISFVIDWVNSYFNSSFYSPVSFLIIHYIYSKFKMFKPTTEDLEIFRVASQIQIDFNLRIWLVHISVLNTNFIRVPRVWYRFARVAYY